MVPSLFQKGLNSRNFCHVSLCMFGFVCGGGEMRPSYVLWMFQKYRLHSNGSPMSSMPAIDIWKNVVVVVTLDLVAVSTLSNCFPTWSLLFTAYTLILILLTETYLGPHQTSMMELITKVVNSLHVGIFHFSSWTKRNSVGGETFRLEKFRGRVYWGIF